MDNDVLPDKWDDVVIDRRRKLRVFTFKTMFDPENYIKPCMTCPMARVYNNGDYVVTACIVNRCIKQYPHKIDNEEFL